MTVFSQTKRWLPIAIFVMLLLTLALAPRQSPERGGSTYSRDPDGYGAWYAYMEDRGTPVQRWRKSPSDWEDYALAQSQKITLIQIHSAPRGIGATAWLKNAKSTLVSIGIDSSATIAPFRTSHSTPSGTVQIETRRRFPWSDLDPENSAPLLSDEFGVIVWKRSVESGGGENLIVINSPHFAANAYQDFPGNYEFLAQLVTQTEGEVWVDEYLHGYRDEVISSAEKVPLSLMTWETYLRQSPLFLLLVQGGVIVFLLFIAQNQRFGSPSLLNPPSIDNTIAYIGALAGVLRQANSSTFVWETLAKAERIYLQNQLGLGKGTIERSDLERVWTEQTGRSSEELQLFFSPPTQGSETALSEWLIHSIKIRQQFAEKNKTTSMQ